MLEFEDVTGTTLSNRLGDLNVTSWFRTIEGEIGIVLSPPESSRSVFNLSRNVCETLDDTVKVVEIRPKKLTYTVCD